MATTESASSVQANHHFRYVLRTIYEYNGLTIPNEETFQIRLYVIGDTGN